MPARKKTATKSPKGKKAKKLVKKAKKPAKKAKKPAKKAKKPTTKSPKAKPKGKKAKSPVKKAKKPATKSPKAQPKGKKTEKPATKSPKTTEPVEKPVEKPVEMPDEKPIEKPVEQPAEPAKEDASGQAKPAAADPKAKPKRKPKPPPPPPSPVELLLARRTGLEFIPFDLSGWKVDDLITARALPALVTELLVPADRRERFQQTVTERDGLGSEIHRDFLLTFGWSAPAELAVWLELEAALRARRHPPEEVGGWLVALDLCRLDEKTRKRRNYFAWTHGDNLLGDPVALYTGLVRYGTDASGDSALACLLPNEADLIEVYQYDHESGCLEGWEAYSLCDFLLYQGIDDDHPDHAERERLSKAFNRKIKPIRKRRPAHLDPLALFERTEWLAAMIDQGREPYAFGELIGRAPGWEQWNAEKELLPESPHLSNYWPLAHWFMGNDGACREAIGLARKCPGRICARLADTAGRLLDGARIDLGNMPINKIDELRALVRANVVPDQLGPLARSRMKEERGQAGEPTLSKKEAKRALADGQDPFELMAKVPTDVATHDLALEAVAKQDKKLAKQVEAYFRERVEEPDNRWPDEDLALDARLSLPMAAAFRSGLGYEHTHKQAFAGVTQALAAFDDDRTAEAWAEAIERLDPADPRLEIVIASLADSKHERRPELLDQAVERFFTELDMLIERKKARTARHPTLDDMYAVDGHLYRALELVLERADEGAGELAKRIAAITTGLSAIRTSWGLAMRVAVEQKLEELADRARAYCRTVVEHPWADGQPSEDVCFNLSESALALVALSSDTASADLTGLLATARELAPAALVGVCGGLLAGLLVATPLDPDLLTLTARVLGNRSLPRGPHLYGALRGVAAALAAGRRLPDAADWIRPHLLDGLDGLGNEPTRVGQAAREAWASVKKKKKKPPAYDDARFYASDLAKTKLLGALDDPQVSAEHVLERIRKDGLKTKAAPARIGDWLADQLRFSADLADPCMERHCWQGLGAMLIQGEGALEPLADLLDLPQLHGEWAGPILQVMRYALPEAKVRAFLAKAKPAQLLDALHGPEARWLGWLDLLTGWAALDPSPVALAAVAGACAWRFRHLDDFANRDDLVAQRLPQVLASFGERARPEFDRFLALTEGHESQEAFQRAEESLQLWAADGLPLDLFQEQNEVALKFTIYGYEEKYQLKLGLKRGKNPGVVIDSSESDLAFRGWVDEIRYQDRIACKDFDAARELAGKLLKHALIMGFRL